MCIHINAVPKIERILWFQSSMLFCLLPLITLSIGLIPRFDLVRNDSCETYLTSLISILPGFLHAAFVERKLHNFAKACSTFNLDISRSYVYSDSRSLNIDLNS